MLYERRGGNFPRIYSRGFCCLVFMNYERPNLPAFLTVVLLVLLSIIVLGEVQDYYNPPITEQHNPALTAEPDSALELDKEQSQQPQRPSSESEKQPQQQPQQPKPTPKLVSTIQVQSVTPTAEELKMINLVNQESQKAGLQPLVIDNRLVYLARLKSQDMIDYDYFDHTSPTYGEPSRMISIAGIPYLCAGENLAGAYRVEIAHNGLMNSPGHRANILHPDFTHIGVGAAHGGPYKRMFTQLFIGVNSNRTN
jgi:uncharacterized YkwD family protein